MKDFSSIQKESVSNRLKNNGIFFMQNGYINLCDYELYRKASTRTKESIEGIKVAHKLNEEYIGLSVDLIELNEDAILKIIEIFETTKEYFLQ